MSLHINAEKKEVAETVLLPGDPLRAKWMAETFLKNISCYNEVRGMLGFTGEFQGKRISIQGSGMGIPSSMIYYHELIHYYGAKTLMRVGTAGSFQSSVKIRDIVLAMSASTTSGINNVAFNNANYAPTADFDLLTKAAQYASDKDIAIKVGNVLSADEFYTSDPDSYKHWAEHGVLCAEMEASGLYTIAAKNKVRALAILTISDSLVTKEQCTVEERERSFEKMAEIALHIS